jgi:hypothetical protein
VQEADAQLTGSSKDSSKKAQSSPDLHQQPPSPSAATADAEAAKQNGASLPSHSTDGDGSSPNGAGRHTARPKR